MNRSKRLQYAISLASVLSWLNGRHYAEQEHESSPDRPPSDDIKSLRELLSELRQGYRREPKHD